MDWMGRCVGGKIERAMLEAEIGVAELAHGVGVPEVVLEARLAEPATITATELILVAAVLSCDIRVLLPCLNCIGMCLN